MKEEYTVEDFKYLRVGYSPRDRNADAIVTAITDLFPGDGIMPQRWRWDSQDSFLKRYGDLGILLWAKAASYHLLMVNGVHVFRIWTDSANTCVADLNESFARIVAAKGFDVEDIPESCDRKCKPLTKRTRLVTVNDGVKLMEVASEMYGLKKWKV